VGWKDKLKNHHVAKIMFIMPKRLLKTKAKASGGKDII